MASREERRRQPVMRLRYRGGKKPPAQPFVEAKPSREPSGEVLKIEALVAYRP
jgi:hypothetical protein